MEVQPDVTEGNSSTQTGRQGWWLNTKRRRPEWQSLSAAGVATFSGRPRDNFTAAQPGDPVLIYVATPDKAIRAAGIVVDREGRGKTDEAKDAASPTIDVQLAFEIPSPLAWRDIGTSAALAEAEPVRQRSSGNLFYLAPAEYEIIRALIVERNPELEAAFTALNTGNLPLLRPEPSTFQPNGNGRVVRETEESYSVQPEQQQAAVASLPAINSLDELSSLTLMPRPQLAEIRDLLVETRQIVLTGPPGTGKTWLARALAALVANDPARAQVTQFHPSTSYEDFVEGLKPRVNAWGQVTYAVLPGLFARFCAQARKDPDRRYVLVIDEINRAPLARVFGELLYALEYRGPAGAVALAPSSGSGAGANFYVPENLFLIGTMNSADRSIALVDYALRRRFRFVDLEPSGAVLESWLQKRGVDRRQREIMVRLMEEVNNRLVDALGPDYQLGHSYFMLAQPSSAVLNRLWRTALRPLLIEYFMPNTVEVEEYAALFNAATATLDDAPI